MKNYEKLEKFIIYGSRVSDFWHIRLWSVVVLPRKFTFPIFFQSPLATLDRTPSPEDPLIISLIGGFLSLSLSTEKNLGGISAKLFSSGVISNRGERTLLESWWMVDPLPLRIIPLCPPKIAPYLRPKISTTTVRRWWGVSTLRTQGVFCVSVGTLARLLRHCRPYFCFRQVHLGVVPFLVQYRISFGTVFRVYL